MRIRVSPESLRQAGEKFRTLESLMAEVVNVIQQSDYRLSAGGLEGSSQARIEGTLHKALAQAKQLGEQSGKLAVQLAEISGRFDEADGQQTSVNSAMISSQSLGILPDSHRVNPNSPIASLYPGVEMALVPTDPTNQTGQVKPVDFEPVESEGITEWLERTGVGKMLVGGFVLPFTAMAAMMAYFGPKIKDLLEGIAKFNVVISLALLIAFRNPKFQEALLDLLGDGVEILALASHAAGPVVPLKAFITGDPRDIGPIKPAIIDNYDPISHGMGVVVNGEYLLTVDGDKIPLTYDSESDTYHIGPRTL